MNKTHNLKVLTASIDTNRVSVEKMQELLGHSDVSTTMIYTHVLNRGGRGVVSPADSLLAAYPIARDGHASHDASERFQNLSI